MSYEQLYEGQVLTSSTAAEQRQCTAYWSALGVGQKGQLVRLLTEATSAAAAIGPATAERVAATNAANAPALTVPPVDIDLYQSTHRRVMNAIVELDRLQRAKYEAWHALAQFFQGMAHPAITNATLTYVRTERQAATDATHSLSVDFEWWKDKFSTPPVPLGPPPDLRPKVPEEWLAASRLDRFRQNRFNYDKLKVGAGLAAAPGPGYWLPWNELEGGGMSDTWIWVKFSYATQLVIDVSGV